jgi:UDP-glucose 6-dehydrogenase
MRVSVVGPGYGGSVSAPNLAADGDDVVGAQYSGIRW